jgi:hypothetical protein
MIKPMTSPQSIGLLEILRKVEARPGMYLGTPSVSQLFIFLAGYKTARRELAIDLTASEEDFCSEFQPWLQQKYQMKTVTSWAQMILSHSVDETEAFRMFFKLLNEFLSRNQTFAEPSSELNPSDNTNLEVVR